MGVEQGIENAIKQFVICKGGFITKVQSGSVMKAYTNTQGITRQCKIKLAEAGTPDMMGVLNGHFIGVEVKKNDKEVQKWLAYPNGLRGKPVKFDKRVDAQKEASKQIRSAGGFFAIVSSVDELEEDLISVGILPAQSEA